MSYWFCHSRKVLQLSGTLWRTNFDFFDKKKKKKFSCTRQSACHLEASLWKRFLEEN
jgi:hypothetical protein